MSSSAYSKSTGVSSGGGSQAAASDSKSSSSGSGKYSSANGSAAGISSYYSTDYGSLSSSVAFSADHDGETSIRQSAMAKSSKYNLKIENFLICVSKNNNIWKR